MDWENDSYRTKYKIMGMARKLFRYHPLRKQAKDRAKVAPYTFKCEKCGNLHFNPPKNVSKASQDKAAELGAYWGKVHVDHIDCVVDPLIGFVDWNTYFNRLFCSLDNLQVLCEDCHKEKSGKENEIRRKNRKKA